MIRFTVIEKCVGWISVLNLGASDVLKNLLLVLYTAVDIKLCNVGIDTTIGKYY